MLIPESVILNTLRNGFSALAEGSAQQLFDVFDDANAIDVNKMFTLLSNKRFNIILGFPPANIKDSTIALTLGSSEEAEQFLGSNWDEQMVGVGGLHPGRMFNFNARSTMFQSQWRITIYSTNADLGVRLSYLVTYVLLSARTKLNGVGLLEQKLSMTDFEPIPQYLPDIVFVRTLMFSAKSKVNFNKVQSIDILDRVEVTDDN